MKLRFSMRGARRTVVVAVILVSLATVGTGSSAPAQSGEPIVVGSTLSLTGAFGATGVIHKAAGETFIRWINANGGLLGRPVQWRLLNDESDLGQGHGALRAADQPGRRRPDHGAVRDPQYRRGAGSRPAPRLRAAKPHGGAHVRAHLRLPVPDVVGRRQAEPLGTADGLPHAQDPAAAAEAGRLRHQHGRIDELHLVRPAGLERGGAVEWAKKQGFNVVLDLKHPPVVSDWGSIAAQVRAANPDFVWNSGLALDPANLIRAMEQLNYRPAQFFTSSRPLDRS